PAINARSGSRSPNARSSLSIVVDSPPGRTRPSTASSSARRRTAVLVAPACSSASRCSRTSPWSARTPMVVVTLIPSERSCRWSSGGASSDADRALAAVPAVDQGLDEVGELPWEHLDLGCPQLADGEPGDVLDDLPLEGGPAVPREGLGA